MPWDDTGNFAVAAHRRTYGEPFRYINELKAGDHVVVETSHGWFVYALDKELPQTDPGNVGHHRADPEGRPVHEAGEVHHADDLHAGVGLDVPAHLVGPPGAGRPAVRAPAGGAEGSRSAGLTCPIRENTGVPVTMDRIQANAAREQVTYRAGR